MYVAKTKALISFTVAAKLISVFVLAYKKHAFSRNDALCYFDFLQVILKLSLGYLNIDTQLI